MTAAAQPLLGAHVSTAGGVTAAFARGESLGCRAMQVFVKSPAQWSAPPLAAATARAFRVAHRRSAIGPVVAHAAYLVNLAAADLTLRRRSRAALAAELRRAARLGLAALVVHPGAAGGRDAATALELAAASLRWVCAATRGCPTRLLLENTAGQGTLLGGPLAHLEVLRRGLTRRVGVCLDTCHAFAAGHAIHEQAGYAEFLAEAGERFGWAALGCLHLNDSLHPFASRRDRHAHIGDGHIGLPTFARLLHDPRLAGVPMIVETETGPDLSGHRRDLETLRRLAAGEPC